jgi:hypothetical protein
MRDELHALQPAYPQSRRIIRHFDLRFMEIGHGCNEAQTETTARAVTAPLAGRNLPR